MKNKFGEYFLGLDIGTDSIGWAVTDEKYNIKKFNGKATWGIRLFEAGKTAEDRRLHRSARRRNQRKVQRIKLLQEIFSEEISKVDIAFFQRLNDSKYYIEDKTSHQPNTLFNDRNYNDEKYHEDYPTIYHLRQSLIKNDEKVDIRLIYLALHHIVKHRGHFLFPGENFESISDFEPVFKALINEINDEWNIEVEYQSIDDIKSLIKDNTIGINDKKKKLEKLIYLSDQDGNVKHIKAMVHLMAGASVNLSDLFNDESLVDEDDKKIKIKFGGSKFEDDYEKLSDLLNEKIYYVDKLKSVYDWGLLENILNGEKYISDAKVKIYEKHRLDLLSLKKLVKKYIPEKYKEIFSDINHSTNYSAYVGKGKINNKKIKNPKLCQQEDFLKYLEKVFEKFKDTDDSELKNILSEISNGTFLPKQVSKDNSVLPYQIHLVELEKILLNTSKFYDFLSKKDETGFSGAEKIIKLFKFRIPYYVGPLNDAHKNKENIGKGTCWITKKSNEPIRPWNFEDVVDVDRCAEDFIIRMTNKCTYLIGSDVIPKNSLLYSEFMVLNELNNLRINGAKVSNDIKTKIFDELFKNKKKVTQKAVKNFLKIEGYGTDIELTGIDGDFKSSMTSYIDFKNILGEKIKNIEMVEEIIRWIVLFGDDKKILRKRIENNYKTKLSDDEIRRIISLRYSGWGRFSKEFLTEIYHINKSTGETFNIIQAMRGELYAEKPKNLMELLSNEYDYFDGIEKYNKELSDDIDEISYNIVEELAVSPAIKRSIWQSLLITKEIVKIANKPPKKVFIEMARGPEEKKRTISRRKQLMDLYEVLKGETRDWVKELEGKTDENLRSDRLYLYYTQMGKCMYTSETIDLGKLFDRNIYDIDHIYPQSKVKDDSLGNRVLVKKDINAKKGDVYPIPSEIRNRDINISLWKMLYEKKFIGKKKYERLTRGIPFSNNELADFISRQIVETRQSTKAVAQAMKRIYENIDIVYVKAGNISRFRQHFDLIKVRDVNDYHHAKDAYLSIVVGNVFDTKFSKNPYKFIKEGNKYTLNERVLYNYDVKKGDYYAWKKDETIKKIKEVMNKNNILFTRYAYEQKGQLFDLLPMRKGKGQLPLKSSDSKMHDIRKYGGYNNVAGASFTLVEHKEKGKIIRSIEYVPVHLSKSMEKDKNKLIEHLENNLELKECKLLIPKIKKNSLFKINGFLMHLSSRSNDSLFFKNAIQLVVDYKSQKYIKNLIKYNARVNQGKRFKREILAPSEYDAISREENLRIYDIFLEKLKSTIYSVKLAVQIKKFENGRELFIGLSENEQCELLVEALHLFQCNIVHSDLRLIDGVKKAGTISSNKVISKDKVAKNKISIINQSSTGLFETEVNLLEI